MELWIIGTGLALFVGTIIAQARRVRTSDKMQHFPRCGACHYCITGLSGRICPECGADLFVVGIATSRLDAQDRWIRALFRRSKSHYRAPRKTKTARMAEHVKPALGPELPPLRIPPWIPPPRPASSAKSHKAMTRS